ncbi:MAG: MotA/TolQ/ExbB proton channel family protein, partial [Gammaproteobacteria bacterium]
TLLASVGSTAPFVGLFGTVWGIHHALVRIGATGQATIDQIAGPVGEALIMTAIGLAVAVPAVLGYNAILRRNSLLLSKLQAFANALLVYATTGARFIPDGPLARSESAPSRVEATV